MKTNPLFAIALDTFGLSARVGAGFVKDLKPAFLRCDRILSPPCVPTRTQLFIVYCNLDIACLLCAIDPPR